MLFCSLQLRLLCFIPIVFLLRQPHPSGIKCESLHLMISTKKEQCLWEVNHLYRRVFQKDSNISVSTNGSVQENNVSIGTPGLDQT